MSKLPGNRPALVIFDCDGVLVDSEPIANRILHEGLLELGLELSYDEVIRRFVGRSLRSCIEDIEGMLGAAVAPEVWRAMQADTFAAFERELQAMPLVEQVIDRLDMLRIPYCVASSGDPAKIRHSLQLTGLLGRFEPDLFSASEVARGKPAPDLFLHAAARLGIDRSMCWVIEDSDPGIQAGLAAGMQVFALVAGPRPLPASVVRLSGHGELLELLDASGVGQALC